MKVIGMGPIEIVSVLKVEKTPPEGDANDDIADVQELTDGISGGGLMALKALSKMGIGTGIIGALGDDHLGAWAMDQVRFSEIDATGLVVKRGKTGRRFIVSEDVESVELKYPGVNSELQLGDLNLELIKGSEWLHMEVLDDPNLLRIQKQLLQGLLGTKLAIRLDRSISSLGLDAVRAFLQRADLVFLDEPTAEALTDKPLEEAGFNLAREGDIYVVIRHGDSFYGTNGDRIDTASVPSCQEGSEPPFEVFLAGFLAGASQDLPMDTCLGMGAKAATIFSEKGSLEETFSSSTDLMGSETVDGPPESDKVAEEDDPFPDLDAPPTDDGPEDDHGDFVIEP